MEKITMINHYLKAISPSYFVFRPLVIASTLFASSFSTVSFAHHAEVIVEAEDYVTYSDSDASNNGGAYRNDGVDIKSRTDEGFFVGWTEPGEWLEYKIEIAAGSHDVSSLVASTPGGGSYTLTLDGAHIGSRDIAATGGWQTWQTQSVGQAFVETAGIHTLRVNIISGEFNLDNIRFEAKSVTDADHDGVLGSQDLCPNTPEGREVDVDGCQLTPINQGVIEAENYLRYYDKTVGNEGAAYRSDNVDIQASDDINGGYNIGWIDAGEWLEYTVDVAKLGKYNLDIRLASEMEGASFNVLVNNTNKASFKHIASTGGWQHWQTHTANLGSLVQGKHRIRLQFNAGPINLNWIALKEDSADLFAGCNINTSGEDLLQTLNAACSNAIDSYTWDFGDGTSANGGSVNHIYAKSGRYDTTVTLVADNQVRTLTQRIEIIEPNTVNACFYLINREGIHNYNAECSSGSNLNYHFDFGDGFSTDQLSGLHSFTEDSTYNVALTTLSDNNGADSVQQTLIVSSNSPVVIPAHIEAEDYTGYRDNSTGNQGGAYRNHDVDIEQSNDGIGAYNVGWMEVGESLFYDIKVDQAKDPNTGDNYTEDFIAKFRVASAIGGDFAIFIDGRQISDSVNIENTGGWQNWITKNIKLGQLSVGNHALEIRVLSRGFNLNWISFITEGSSSTPPE